VHPETATATAAHITAATARDLVMSSRIVYWLLTLAAIWIAMSLAGDPDWV
jgi:hypothetical protein